MTYARLKKWILASTVLFSTSSAFGEAPSCDLSSLEPSALKETLQDAFSARWVSRRGATNAPKNSQTPCPNEGEESPGSMTTPYGKVIHSPVEASSQTPYSGESSRPPLSVKPSGSGPLSTPVGSNVNARVLNPVLDEGVHCPPDTENEGFVINFSEIAFEEYIHFLSKLTDTNFVYNPEDVQFTVSIQADEPTNIKEIRTALLQTLRVNGLMLVAEGNNLIISQDPELRAVGTVVSEELQNLCNNTDALITRVFYLKNTSATKVAAIVSAMVSPGAIVEASEETHHLIVTDLTSNIESIADLLQSLNNPEASFEIGTYRSQKTYVNNLVNLAEKILYPIADTNPLVMVPQSKSSTIFVVSTPYLVRKSLEVLQALDVGDGSPQKEDTDPYGDLTNAEFYIYKLQYHKGAQIEETLKDIAEDLTQMGSFNNQLLMTINSAQWIESTNSLLFLGSPATIKQVKELLAIIDAPLRQVFIEVLAVRTSIGNSLQLGVQYGYRARVSDRFNTVGSLFTSPNPTAAGNAAKPNLFTQGLDAVTGQNIPVPQTSNELGLSAGAIGNVLFKGANLYFDLAGLVNALQTDLTTQVVTNPKLVTQDTIPATFYVGSTRPFQTNSILQASGSSTGNFVTASIEYRQLGLSLTVTPYLGNSNVITLEIEQSTSDFVNNAVPSNGGGSDNFAIVPVTNDSSITTRVHIPDKHFLMISGMLEDISTKDKTAIPCLGGLPIIGDFLGVRANSISKDNFIIFLRPQIIDTTEELDQITSREGKLFQQKSEGQSFIRNSSKLYFMNQKI